MKKEEVRMQNRMLGLRRDAVLCFVQICGIYVWMWFDGARARL